MLGPLLQWLFYTFLAVYVLCLYALLGTGENAHVLASSSPALSAVPGEEQRAYYRRCSAKIVLLMHMALQLVARPIAGGSFLASASWPDFR